MSILQLLKFLKKMSKLAVRIIKNQLNSAEMSYAYSVSHKINSYRLTKYGVDILLR